MIKEASSKFSLRFCVHFGVLNFKCFVKFPYVTPFTSKLKCIFIFDINFDVNDVIRHHFEDDDSAHVNVSADTDLNDELKS